MKKVYISKTGKEENAKKARDRMKRYSSSKKGLKVRAKYRDRNREHIRKYMREYFRKRRAQGAEEGLCGNCLKYKRMPGIIFCRKCRDNARRNAQNQKVNQKKANGGNKMAKKKSKSSKKEREAGELWEAIKKRDYGAGSNPSVDINTAIKHLKEVLEDEKNNR